MWHDVRYQNENPRENPVEEVKKVTYRPATDIYELKDGFKLLLEMPSVDRDSLKVYIKDNQLHIEGEKKKPLDDGKFLLQEIRDVAYERVFELGDDIDPDSIAARYEQGILEISLKKKEKEPVKEIKIQ